LYKEQRDEKGKIKSFKEGELVLWMPKARKIKGGKFTLPLKGPFKIQKCLITTLWSCQPQEIRGHKK
jgi:hypothetical protein